MVYGKSRVSLYINFDKIMFNFPVQSPHTMVTSIQEREGERENYRYCKSRVLPLTIILQGIGL